MTPNSKTTFRFLFVITAFLILSFAVHGLVQHQLGIGFLGKQIIGTYTFNYLISITVFVLIKLLSVRHGSKVDLVFLYSSLLKFFLFYILILPGYGVFNGIKSAEFASFFIPYSISSIVEIFYLIRLINR
jgi:hypothetical protein